MMVPSLPEKCDSEFSLPATVRNEADMREAILLALLLLTHTNGWTHLPRVSIRLPCRLRGSSISSSATSTPTSLFAAPLPHHSSPNIETYLRNAESAITSSRHPASNNLASDSSKPQVYANSYVDLGLVEVVGFDYDYTIVQYNNALLELIYEMARDLLVTELRFPPEICDLKFDPTFPIRGLAVDRKTGWICQLSYTHKVSLAYEGKKKVPTERFRREFKSKRSLTPNERQKVRMLLLLSGTDGSYSILL